MKSGFAKTLTGQSDPTITGSRDMNEEWTSEDLPEPGSEAYERYILISTAEALVS